MINRAAIILKYRNPAVDWVNAADPYDSELVMTLADINKERTVFLVQDEVADSPDKIEKWVKANHDVLFERELDSWYADSSLWPKNRSYKQFKEWFEVECHSIIEDTLDSPIVDDDL